MTRQRSTERSAPSSTGCARRERTSGPTSCLAAGPGREMEGRGEVLVLSSNNYLGLAGRPEVVEAGIEGLRRYGAGTGSVRFICGTFEPHLELERELADFVGTEAALTYVSCWNANEASIPSLTDESTVILSDELNHASIIDAIRLSKPARKVIYRHSSMDELRAGLESCERGQRKLVITDGVFSMEGDLARLPDILELAREHDAVVHRRRLARHGRDGRDGPRRRRALRRARRGGRDHEHAREGARRRGGRLRRGERGGLRHALPALAAAPVLERAAADGRAARRCEAVRVLRREPQLVERLHENTRCFRGALERDRLRAARRRSGDHPDHRRRDRVRDQDLASGCSTRASSSPASASRSCRKERRAIRVQMSAALEDEHLDRALEAFGGSAASSACSSPSSRPRRAASSSSGDRIRVLLLGERAVAQGLAGVLRHRFLHHRWASSAYCLTKRGACPSGSRAGRADEHLPVAARAWPRSRSSGSSTAGVIVAAIGAGTASRTMRSAGVLERLGVSRAARPRARPAP